MRRFHFNGVGKACLAVFALAVVATASAQGVVGRGTPPNPDHEATRVIRPSAQATTAPAPSIDSRSFFPQIRKSMSARIIKPENPTRLGMPPAGQNNNIAQGGGTNALKPNRGARFPGIGQTGYVPPDPSIGVGPNHVVQVVNSHIAWFDKNTGQNQFMQALTPNAFLNGVPGVSDFTFDPKVFYDHDTQRFFVVVLDVDFNGQQSAIVVCVSDDDDPNGVWYRYRIGNNVSANGGTYWGDYPGWGVSDDYVICSTNLFGFTNEPGSWIQVQIFDKDAMINNQPVVENKLYDENSFTLQVARMVGTQGAAYGVSIRSGSSCYVYKIEDNAGTPEMTIATVATPNTSFGGVAQGNGFFLDGIAGRAMDASYANGKLVACASGSSGDNLGTRWWSFDVEDFTPSVAPTLDDSGFVQGNATTSIWMPAIAVNEAGTIGLVASRLSHNGTPEMVFMARAAADPPGTMSDPLVGGASPNFSSNAGFVSRWGDYAGIAVDPLDQNIFWICAELLVDGNLTWSTEITSFETSSVPSTVYNVGTVTPVIGATQSGNILSFVEDDDDYYVQNSVLVPGRGHYSAYDITFPTETDPSEVEALQLDFIGKVSAGLITNYVYVWNHQANRFDLMRTGAIRTIESPSRFQINNASKYVAADGTVTMRIFTLEPIRSKGALSVTPYNLLSEQAWLTLNPRR